MAIKTSHIASLELPAPKDFESFPEEAYLIPVVDHFSNNAEKFPDRPAVIGKDLSLSYGELNRRANQLAHEILARRGDREEPIAFLLGIEPSAVIALLGIWKSGKFYLGLDPDNPQSRLESILEDIGTKVIVTNNTHLSAAQKLAKGKLEIINVDELSTSLSSDNPSIHIPLDRLSAVFYTSGSSGKPKGVMVDHRFSSEKALSSANSLGLSASDRITLPFAFSFGWSTAPLTAALIPGGTLYLIDFKTMSSMEIAKLLIDEKITITPFAASMFRNFMASLPEDFDGKFVDIRFLSAGGEAFAPLDILQWKDRFSTKCILRESLASTEAAVISQAFHPIKNLASGEEPKSPKPVFGVEIFILDDSRNVLPVGQVGQIGIKSTTLMKGYWNRPEINSTLFMDDPSGSGEKILVSGDLGRLLPDGSLEFVGRADSMIKVRGSRVEPGEIETAIRKNSQVKNVVVAGLTKPNSKDEVALVAYLVMGNNDHNAVKDLRKFLHTRLPEYMVPSYFVFLEKIPTTTRGKVDRKRLPQPDWSGSNRGSEYLAPRNKKEERLVKLWQELLERDKIGVEDDFFLLGGHSLAAFRMMAKISEEFGSSLPMQILLQHPTIAELSKVLDGAQPAPKPSSIVAFRNKGKSGSLFLVPGAARTALHTNKLASRLNDSLAVYGLEYPGMEGYLEPFDNTVTLAAFFVDQILSVQAKGPFYLGGFCFGGVIAYEIAQQLIEIGHKIGGVFLLDSSPPSMKDDELDNKDPRYYLGRVRSLLRTENREVASSFFLSRVKRILGIDKRKRDMTSKELRAAQPSWVENPLDEGSLKVIEGLRQARKSYTPKPLKARGLALLSSMSRGTPREDWWSGLISDFDCHYIANTSHANIFNKEQSLEDIASIINEVVSAK